MNIIKSGTILTRTIFILLIWTIYFYLPVIIMILIIGGSVEKIKLAIIIITLVFFPILFITELLALSKVNEILNFDYLSKIKDDIYINSKPVKINDIVSVDEKIFYNTFTRLESYIYYLEIKTINSSYNLLESLSLNDFNPIEYFKKNRNFNTTKFLLKQGLKRNKVKKKY